MTGFLWSDDEEAFFADGASSSQKKSPKDNARPGDSLDTPLSVSQLNERIKQVMDRSFGTIWIAGEISNLSQSGAGHVYLTLKDATGQVSAVIWRSTLERIGIDIGEGMAVIVQARLDVYSPRGSYQLIINRMEQQGLGALQAAFRKLHKRLEQEGLFAQERKKPLPRFPMKIGFVTSPSGAAIHDFLQVLRRRWPMAQVLIIPSRVQGDGAADEIARGIRVAGKIQPPLDVLVVGRGGGSIEDLWCFNEEVAVRAIANCPIPTISAVGHEIDVTLCDLAADVRALTPTEAGEIVAPSRDELLATLETVERRLGQLVTQQIQRAETRLTSLCSRAILEEPERILERPTQRVDEAHRDLDLAVDQWFESLQLRLQKSAQVLEVLSPLNVLSRGYSFSSDAATGELIRTVKDVREGQVIKTTLSTGGFESQVTKRL